MKFVGVWGTIEVLAEGTVEREVAAAGQRIHSFAEMVEMLRAQRDTERDDSERKLRESPGNERDPASPDTDSARRDS